ncbi:MAG: hypothetical protein ACK4GC_08270 [Paracoccaceae bacterium]
MHFLSREYTAQSVALATGATSKQITDWCNQGLIVGQREPLGRGHKRTFSWFNVMEIAGALALMEIGVKAPGDAFRISMLFSHSGDGGRGHWEGDDGLTDNDPERLPALPYHHLQGETYLLVAGGEGQVILTKDGTVNTYMINRLSARPVGFIALNMSEVFFHVAHRMALDGREVLDEVYTENSEG